ncbi:hypothetical protein ACHWQZ_G008280 [Mnemiopsis leidyi]
MTEADSSRLPQTGSVTVKVLIPNYLAGALIGKGGEELNIIRKQTGGIIKLSQNKAYYPGTDERVVLIKGRPDSAFALLKLVHSKIRTRKAPPIINGRPFNEIRLQQMKLIIANSTAGKVIGTGGEVIKMIQQEHNVKLFITNVDNPKEKRIQNERICTVKGDELSVNRCMIDLVERIAADEMADLDTNIDYPKCEDGDVIFGMERPVFVPGLGMGITMPGMAGIPTLGPSYEDLFMLQEQTKALQAMSGLSQGHGGLLQVNPLAGMQGVSSMNGGLMGAQPSLQLMMDPYKRLLGQKQDMEILTPEMAMMKDFSGNIMVDQYADPWPKQQNQLQSLLLQNPALAAQQAAAKTAAEQISQTPQEQFFIPNSLTGSVQLGLGKRFTSATPTSVSAAHELINRANGLTTSGIYQSPLMSHVVTSNSIAAQTAAIQAAQNAALQQQIQLQALQQQQQQQQTQPNPLLAQQNSSLQALQDAQLQVQAQAAQIQALQAQSNQLHSNSVAQAQLHAQVQAQLMMNQQNAAAAAVHGHQSSKKQRYHPYGIPPPPPPPTATVEAAPMPPKQVSVAPQVQAPPTPSVAPTISQPATAAASS